MQSKICNKCGVEKPLEKFNTCTSEGNGRKYRRNECRKCGLERQKGWRDKNRERIRALGLASMRRYRAAKMAVDEAGFRRAEAEKAKRWNYQTKEKAYLGLGGYICKCCGETEPLFLSIDHINNDGYERRKAGEGSGSRLTQVVYRYFREHGTWPTHEFQILCMNCQHGKSRNGGICPHKEGVTIIPKGSTAKRLEAHRTPQG